MRTKHHQLCDARPASWCTPGFHQLFCALVCIPSAIVQTWVVIFAMQWHWKWPLGVTTVGVLFNKATLPPDGLLHHHGWSFSCLQPARCAQSRLKVKLSLWNVNHEQFWCLCDVHVICSLHLGLALGDWASAGKSEVNSSMPLNSASLDSRESEVFSCNHSLWCRCWRYKSETVRHFGSLTAQGVTISDHHEDGVLIEIALWHCFCVKDHHFAHAQKSQYHGNTEEINRWCTDLW